MKKDQPRPENYVAKAACRGHIGTSTLRLFLLGLGLSSVAVCTVYAVQSAPPPPSTPLARATLDRYCVTCHNQKRPTADLALDVLDLTDVSANAATLEKVAARLRSRTMPPAGLPRPDRLDLRCGRRPHRSGARRPQRGASGSWPSGHSSPEPGGVHERRPRSAGARYRWPVAAAGRRFGIRVRQHLRSALGVAGAARAVHESRPARSAGLPIGDAAMRPAVQTYSVPPTLLQHDRMSERSAVRHARRPRRSSLLSGRWRIRDSDSSAAHPCQPDSRPGRAERHRGAAGSAAASGSSRWAAMGRATRGRLCRAHRPTSRPPTTGSRSRLASKAGPGCVGVAFPKKSGAARRRAASRSLSVATYEYAGDRDAADERREHRHQRTVRGRGRRRNAEPPPDLRLPALPRGRRRALRDARF